MLGQAKASPPGMPPIYTQQDPALYPVTSSPHGEAGMSLRTACDLADGPWDALFFPATLPTTEPAPSPWPRAVCPSAVGAAGRKGFKSQRFYDAAQRGSWKDSHVSPLVITNTAS